MSLEEANKIVTIRIKYSPNGWYWEVDTHRPYGRILGYGAFEDINDAVEELKRFLRYFTESVLESGDSIRKYVAKHNPEKNEKS